MSNSAGPVPDPFGLSAIGQQIHRIKTLEEAVMIAMSGGTPYLGISDPTLLVGHLRGYRYEVVELRKQQTLAFKRTVSKNKRQRKRQKTDVGEKVVAIRPRRKKRRHRSSLLFFRRDQGH